MSHGVSQMKYAKVLALGVVLCFFGGLARGEDKDVGKQIVGKWTVTKADPGTVPAGTLVEFTKDGKMKVTGKKGDEEVTMQGTYKVEGKKISFALKVGDDEKKKTITVTK